MLFRSAGALIPLLQRGSEEIKKMGEQGGIMSDRMVEALDSAGDQLDMFFSKVKVWGAYAVVGIFNVFKTIGLVAAEAANWWDYLTGKIDTHQRNRTSADLNKELEDAWSFKDAEGKEKKPRKVFDVEEIGRAHV